MTTKIEWTDETWNPVTGCTKVSAGCKNCYAERLAPKVFAGQKIGDMRGGPLRQRVFTDVLCHHERLDAPLHWKKPRRIFVNSMSDLFHEDVPDEFILRVFDVMRQCENGHSAKLCRLVSQHTFQILTKRPARMRDFCTRLRFAQNDARGLYLASKLPHNGYNPMQALRHVWLGVSVEDQATADERIPLLLQTQAAVRFLSCEPLLGPIDLAQWINRPKFNQWHGMPREVAEWECGIHWIIAGGESGPNARPSHPDWFRTLRDECAAAGVPFFFKQWGEWAPRRGLDDIAHAAKGEMFFPGLDYAFEKVGKKAAGRLLDGKLNDEFPS
jgi:protein gp37